ncbi:MAG: DNA mismatch repair endonuclease MutL [Bacteroidales bacterium]|nr:DNA mismatch repair endonuclease MutL [Bacteroidales bacterium]MBN2762601.1 DNA mismatch repair endonuclease MutL [Bacteroidales bacterium]
MADIIRLLSESVANQIAAGEVIQRPASVVKELMENAVDAGSKIISVLAKDGGKTLIQVIDNGCGMSDTDARMCFERHATSKIKEAGDLYAIRTLGFRGEAMASIAAVAQVILRTRRQEDETGTQVTIAGSVVESQEVVTCDAGCNFMVKNLYFNTPARRKFLKTNNAELKHIIHEFQRVALANPQIEFSLTHNDTEIYVLPPANLKQRIIHLFGKSVNQNLTTINTSTSLVKISGYIGKPECAKKKSGEQFFFINNRFMKHPYFHRAIMNAYEKLLPADYLPSYFMFLEADPASIDINIHPTKTEIKFEEEPAVFQILVAAAREALGKFNLVPPIDFNAEQAFEIPPMRKDALFNVPPISFNPGYNPFDHEKRSHEDYHPRFENDVLRHWEKLYHGTDGLSVDRDIPENEIQQKLDLNRQNTGNRFLQLKNKYILTAVKSGLMIIDQRRAHERILFEKYLQIMAHNHAVAQQTMFPETLELEPSDYLMIKELFNDLHTLGFDIRDFGSNSIVLNGCPADMQNPDPKGLVESILEEFKNKQHDIKINARERLMMSLASAAAVNYGKSLSDAEMQELIDRLFACENPNYSPSGHPVVSIISLEEIERKF